MSKNLYVQPMDMNYKGMECWRGCGWGDKGEKGEKTIGTDVIA